MTYGLGTRSYNRSPERREMKRQVAEQTKKFEQREMKRPEIVILLCHCRSFRGPHSPDEHKKLLGDWDWRTPEQREGQTIWEERVK